jgi:hypothetical protein
MINGVKYIAFLKIGKKENLVKLQNGNLYMKESKFYKKPLLAAFKMHSAIKKRLPPSKNCASGSKKERKRRFIRSFQPICLRRSIFISFIVFSDFIPLSPSSFSI